MPFEMLSDKPKEPKRKAFLKLTMTRGAGISVHMYGDTACLINDILLTSNGWGLDSMKPVSFNLGYDRKSKQILIEVCQRGKGEYEGKYASDYYFTSQSLSKVMGHPEVSKYILVHQEGNKLYFTPAKLEDYFD